MVEVDLAKGLVDPSPKVQPPLLIEMLHHVAKSWRFDAESRGDRELAGWQLPPGRSPSEG